MSQNRLGVATVILIALLGLTVWRLNARKNEDQQQPKTAVTLPKVDKDKIDELDIAAPEREKVHLVKKGDTWRMTEPVDAEADADAVSSALAKLAELEVTGTAATVAKNHERLEVDAKKGTHVIAKAGGKPVVDLWIGSYQAGNSMVRVEGQAPVATVRGSIRYAFSKHAREWRNREITEIPTANVQKIVFDNDKGHLEFVRDGDEFKQVLAKGEKPIEPLDANKVKGIVGTASSLNAVDFADPGMTPDQAGLGPNAATCTLELGGDAGAQQIVYRVGSLKDSQYYLQRDGVPTIFLVSQWIGSRLISSKDDLIKKETEEGSNPHSGLPPGSPGNPIPVMPEGVHVGAAPTPAAAKAMEKAAAAKAKVTAAAAKPAAK